MGQPIAREHFGAGTLAGKHHPLSILADDRQVAVGVAGGRRAAYGGLTAASSGYTRGTAGLPPPLPHLRPFEDKP